MIICIVHVNVNEMNVISSRKNTANRKKNENEYQKNWKIV